MEHDDNLQERTSTAPEVKPEPQTEGAIAPLWDFCKRYPESLECLIYDV
jgi:CP12 domain